MYTLKNAGLNTTQRWVKYGRTQWLDCLDLGLGIGMQRLTGFTINRALKRHG